ncbi:MAG: nicotinate-nucleotide--dimethylbenzimidazole phosphoribosyltransferase [Minwuia sp.]|uniref:nicotinate-nucleotide--dimethylbenzimidazole phosphoribosyltransferase n=1 Tax=Minwuia sp. TaxID=2493630 RepID=UPI003A887383
MNITPELPDIDALLDSLPRGDDAAEAAARARQGQLVKPTGSLGRLEDIAVHLARWQGAERPRLETVTITVFAGSHGITKHGVSAFPDEVNAQMLGGFHAGFAAVCQLAEAFGAELKAIDCGVAHPTDDFTVGPAMDAAAFAEAVGKGRASVRGDEDLLIFGEMGIGNTTAAAAVAAAICGGDPAGWVGQGTGVDEDGLARKADVVRRGLMANPASSGNPVEVLRCLGGREMAAILGACLEARKKSIPVLIDGFIATASVAPLGRQGLAHCLSGHASQEHGHRKLLDFLGLDPILDLGMRLGEGSGAATALGIVRAAVACHNGMATFEEAAVAGKNG